MEASERSSLLAVANTIALRLLGAGPRADEAADRAVALIAAQPDRQGALSVAWTTAAVLEECLRTPDALRQSDPPRAQQWRRLLADAPVGAQVVIALRELCGYDAATTAGFCHRTVQEVADLHSIAASWPPAPPFQVAAPPAADEPDERTRPSATGQPGDAPISVVDQTATNVTEPRDASADPLQTPDESAATEPTSPVASTQNRTISQPDPADLDEAPRTNLFSSASPGAPVFPVSPGQGWGRKDQTAGAAPADATTDVPSGLDGQDSPLFGSTLSGTGQPAPHRTSDAASDPATVASSPRGRVWIAAAAVVAALAGITALVTYPGGERPTLSGQTTTTAATGDAAVAGATTQRGCSGVDYDAVNALAVGTRPASLYIPPTASTSIQLMVVLGNKNQTADAALADSNLQPKAQAQGFALLALSNTGSGWNVTEASDGADDEKYITDALSATGSTGCVDTGRVTIIGTGAGAHMAGSYACSHADRVRALVMVGGAYRSPDCANTVAAPVSVQVYAGVNDQFTTIGSTSPATDVGYPVEAIGTVEQQWARANGCVADIQATVDAQFSAATYRSCANGARIGYQLTLGAANSVWDDSLTERVLQFISNAP